MSTDIARLLDVFDLTVDGPYFIHELLTARVTAMRTKLLGMLKKHQDPELLKQILATYNGLHPDVQSRILMSAELGNVLGDWADPLGINGHRKNEIFRELQDLVEREAAIAAIRAGATTAYLGALSVDQFISPLGDVLAHREQGQWTIRDNTRIGDVIAVDFDSPLAHRIEPRSGTLSWARMEPTKADRDSIMYKLEQAIQNIDAVAPGYGLLIRSFTRRIIIRKSVEADDIENLVVGSEQRPLHPGTIRLLNTHSVKVTVAACMEAILHESIHDFISTYEGLNSYLTTTSKEVRPVSPWSGNPIPNHSLAHAVFVYYACHKLFYLAINNSELIENADVEEMQRRITDLSLGFLTQYRVSELFVLEQPPMEGFNNLVDELQNRMLDIYGLAREGVAA